MGMVTRALHRDAYSVVFPDVKVASCPHRGARCRCPCEVDDRVESALVYPNAIPEYDVEHFLAALEPGMPVQYRRKGCAGWWALTIEKIIGELSIPKTKILMRSINPHGLPLPNVYMCTIFVRRTWSSWPHMLHARIQILRSESGERAR
jgi:hypothetical protein